MFKQVDRVGKGKVRSRVMREEKKLKSHKVAQHTAIIHRQPFPLSVSLAVNLSCFKSPYYRWYPVPISNKDILRLGNKETSDPIGLTIPTHFNSIFPIPYSIAITCRSTPTWTWTYTYT